MKLPFASFLLEPFQQFLSLFLHFLRVHSLFCSTLFWNKNPNQEKKLVWLVDIEGESVEWKEEEEGWFSPSSSSLAFYLESAEPRWSYFDTHHL